ncbi:MAG: BACON domain-containing protein [Paludibacteraceae bacterium]|nr:BACON domain-containing protein [Paludibacteraceae bacterium]
MCKRFIVNIFVLFAFAMPLLADEECDQSLKEAKALYNAGKYAEAKGLFVYVQQICSPTYGSANTWVQKCNEAMNGGSKSASSSKAKQSSSTTTLSASKTHVTFLEGGGSDNISITSNKSWKITGTPASWCQVSANSSGIALSTTANPDKYSRSTYIQIATADGKKNLTIYIDQAEKQQTEASSAHLSLSKNSISAPSNGTTVYITINATTAWEIEYPSTGMYSVTKSSSNSIRVVVNKNTSSSSRSDFFNIKTADGSEKVMVSISQSGNYSSSSKSSYGSHSSYSGYTALSDFNDAHGKWEVDWFGARFGLGTGIENDYSLFAFRYSVLKVEPVVLGLKYDFINNYGSFYYQPDIKLVFPWSSDWAAEFGIGPSVQVDLKYGQTAAWFTMELGVLYHWGNVCSSDFFMRYDGIFSIGASINFSTGF